MAESRSFAIADTRLVFLVGAPRSGTTWLQLMLGSTAAIATVNESHLFSSYMRSLFDSWDYFLSNPREIGVHHFVSEKDYWALVHDFGAGIIAHILSRKPGASVVLEKTPEHVAHWRSILKVFPDAYFLHLIRDPRSVIASLRDAQKTWGRHWISSELIDHCTRWNRSVEESRELSKQTKNYIEIRYEDLKTDGAETLLNVFAWIGVERTLPECSEILDRFSIDRLRSATAEGSSWDLSKEPSGFYRKGEIDGWARELSPTQIRLIELATKPFFASLGYRSFEQKAFHLRHLRLNSLAASYLLAREKIRARLHWRAKRFADSLFSR